MRNREECNPSIRVGTVRLDAITIGVKVVQLRGGGTQDVAVKLLPGSYPATSFGVGGAVVHPGRGCRKIFLPDGWKGTWMDGGESGNDYNN